MKRVNNQVLSFTSCKKVKCIESIRINRVCSAKEIILFMKKYELLPSKGLDKNTVQVKTKLKHSKV